MTTNLHDKMLAAIDAYFSASDGTEEEVAENLLLDVRDEINKQQSKAQPAPVQEPVAHPVIAGALFDFMGWLTSRKKTLILSSADNASPAVEAITEFAKMRGLSLDGARVQDWQDIAPKQDVPETNFGNMAEPKIGCVNHDCDKCKAVQEPEIDLRKQWPMNGWKENKPAARRQWVGLTGNEIALINADYPNPQGFARAIEAKLREKNGGAS
jgi:hypothetical protein